MGALRQRLTWGDDGAVHDGPRRYLMMRTDVLMGTLQRLGAEQQQAWLQAWAASTCEHGGTSLQAYAQLVGADAKSLIDSTVQAAADLGWGLWAVSTTADGLQLQVQGSPFVQGWRAARAAAQPGSSASARPSALAAAGTAKPEAPASTPAPCCAPISGMFTALAGMVLLGPVVVEETTCAARQPSNSMACHFTARRTAP